MSEWEKYAYYYSGEAHKLRSERDTALERVEVLVKALEPFACVPLHGTSGGPLVCSEPYYEDGSYGKDLGISPGFSGGTPHEAFKLAREALQESSHER